MTEEVYNLTSVETEEFLLTKKKAKNLALGKAYIMGRKVLFPLSILFWEIIKQPFIQEVEQKNKPQM